MYVMYIAKRMRLKRASSLNWRKNPGLYLSSVVILSVAATQALSAQNPNLPPLSPSPPKSPDSVSGSFRTLIISSTDFPNCVLIAETHPDGRFGSQYVPPTVPTFTSYEQRNTAYVGWFASKLCVTSDPFAFQQEVIPSKKSYHSLHWPAVQNVFFCYSYFIIIEIRACYNDEVTAKSPVLPVDSFWWEHWRRQGKKKLIGLWDGLFFEAASWLKKLGVTIYKWTLIRKKNLLCYR